MTLCVLSIYLATVGFACVRHSSLCTFKIAFLFQSSKATAQAKHSSLHSQCGDMMHDAILLGMLSKSQAGYARMVHSTIADRGATDVDPTQCQPARELPY